MRGACCCRGRRAGTVSADCTGCREGPVVVYVVGQSIVRQRGVGAEESDAVDVVEQSRFGSLLRRREELVVADVVEVQVMSPLTGRSEDHAPVEVLEQAGVSSPASVCRLA